MPTDLHPGLTSKRFRQRGVFTLLTVGVMAMAIGAMGVLAVGYTAWEKGQLQGIADMTALSAARQLANGQDFSESVELAQNNGLRESDTVQIDCVINNTPTNNCLEAVTVRVAIARGGEPLLPFMPGGPVNVLAEATTAPTVVGSVTSNLLAVNSQQSALLNALLGQVLGVNVNVNAASWQGLLGSDIQLDLLGLGLELGAVTIDQILNLGLADLFTTDLFQDALQLGGLGNNAGVTGLLSLLSQGLNAADVTVGDVLALDLSGRTNTVLGVTLGQLAQVGLLNAGKGLTTNVNLPGALALDVGLTILEAPQIFIGRKAPFKDPIATGRTAQVALNVRAQQLLNLNIVGVSLSALDLRLQTRVAGGFAEVNRLNCRYPRAQNDMRMTILPSAAEVCLSSSASNLNSTTGAVTCGQPATIANASILGLANVAIRLGASASVRPNPTVVTEAQLTGVPPFSRTVQLNLGQSLANVLQNTNLNLTTQVSLLGLDLLGLVNPLVNTLVNTLRVALSPVLGAVGAILDSLLAILGISVNETTVNVDSIDCQSVVLTR